MNLVKANQLDIMMMATTLADTDTLDQQSTFIHDPCMWTPERKNHCFLIEHKGQILGFTILRDMNFGKYGLWISLQPCFRNHIYGKLALYISLCKAFHEYKAKTVVSDVYANNKISIKAHQAVFITEDNKREDMITFVINLDLFNQQCVKYKVAPLP
jgi:RimJ/RimL family protein N-acetyltransferase